jgi:hypothetical protein
MTRIKMHFLKVRGGRLGRPFVLQAAALLDLALDEALELVDDRVGARLVSVGAAVAPAHHSNLICLKEKK